MIRIALLIVMAAVAASAESVLGAAPESTDYVYRAQPRDTLISIGRRLLKNPARWRELQIRNAIVRPTRIPLGTPLRIPRDWLLQSAEPATVLAVVGACMLDGASLQPGAILPEGAHLTTAAASHLTLQLADGSLITLRPGSSLKLETLKRYLGTGQRDTVLKLESGGVETQVKPQGDAGRFQIRTPVAVSAVRGTEFRRSLGADALDRTEVVGGAVTVSSATDAAGTRAVNVPGGFGTLSDTGGGPRAPVKLPPPPDLSALPSDWQEAELQVNFAAVAGAHSYRAQLAADPEFQQVLAETAAAAPRLTFAAQPDADYWLRVRSVDSQGLAGADATLRLRRHRLPAAPQPREPAADGFTSSAGAVLRWSEVADAAGYRLQLSPQADFQRIAAEYSGTAPEWRRDLEVGTYYWRVAAQNGAGETGRWSEPQRFSHKPPPARIAQAVVDQNLLRLSWEGKPGQRFRLQLARDAQFIRPLVDLHTEEPHADLPLVRSGTYFARLQSVDVDGYIAPWSQTRRISVPLPWWVKAAPALLVLPFL